MQLGMKPFTRYESPMMPDQPMEWQENKLTQPTAKPQPKQAITGDCDVPPEPDDEL